MPPPADASLTDTQRFEPTQALEPRTTDDGVPTLSGDPTARGSASAAVGYIGRYTLQQTIGEGGLGLVYAAHDPVLSRRIAIKTLNLGIPSEERESLTRMLLQEARAAAGLSHPNIVTVHDAGLSGEGVYIAMELLKGQDLRHLLAQGWRPTPGQAALIVRRVADALAYAHSRGVVHRDIKPANLFMVGRTQPRVLDFGIAHVAEQRDSRDLVAGSPFYMAPEQVRRQPTDRRTDVFSLGVVLYELLTGERPFQGPTLAAITEAVCTHPPAAAHVRKPEVPVELSDIAARAMEKDPSQRYGSARALSRQLRHWLDAHPEALGLADDKPAAPRWRKPVLAAGAAVTGVMGLVALLTNFGLKHEPVAVPTREPVVAMAPSVVAPAPAPTQSTASVAAPAPAPPPPTRTRAAPEEPLPLPARVRSERARKLRLETPSPVAQARRRPPVVAKAPPAPAPVVAPPTGELRLAVTPWARVEIDGHPAGITPPLSTLQLPAGRHEVTLSNEGAGTRKYTLEVVSGRAVVLRHRFGS